MPKLLDPLMIAAAVSHRSSLRVGDCLDNAKIAEIRTELALNGAKWDPQVGDVNTLAAFPLYLSHEEFETLGEDAECLTAEVFAAEREVIHALSLLDDLGIPAKVRRAFQNERPATPAALRVMRFDFHPTAEGWRLSEVNADVPGGYCEASRFPKLFAACVGGEPAGDPIAAWRNAMLAKIGDSGRVALLSAPGYVEDFQVVTCLARELRSHGIDAFLLSPNQMEWVGGEEGAKAVCANRSLAAVVRFFQSEWLPSLGRASGWEQFLRGGVTPIVNPAVAMIAESKRFPLLWPKLQNPMRTWRRLLPETVDPRDVRWEEDENWIVKLAMSNTGDSVAGRGWSPAPRFDQIRRLVKRHPDEWVAQRRFESVPIATPNGEMHVCVGVFTVNGKASGTYCRLSPKPLIDFAAIDAALLLE